MMKTIIISGANFNNKGAQSMLFVAMDEMRKRYPDCELFYLSSENINLENYRVKQLYFSIETSKIINLKLSGIGLLFIRMAKEFLKKIVKINYCIRNPLYVMRVLRECDFIIDVSGYQLGDKWPVEINYYYLNLIKFAQNHKIPIYLMPQSYGPFEYNNLKLEKKKKLIRDISNIMQYPQIVYSREVSGKLALQSLGIEDVILSSDLVLQNNRINLHNIFIDPPKVILPNISSNNSIGIVPNAQCFKFGDNERLTCLYKKMIEELLVRNKTIYLIRHSGEDYKICELIKSFFSDNSNVKILEKEYSCIEYDLLVKSFEFIISSRYHGAVHALRNFVPCITLGWADKYKELMCLLQQEHYNFDISGEIDENAIIGACADMIGNLQTNKDIIETTINHIREWTCFDIFDNGENLLF